MELPVPAVWVTYIVLLANLIVFKVLRLLLFAVFPSQLRLLPAEVIATLELCTACAELGVVFEVHGYIGLGVALFVLCMWWCRVWEDAEACPCGPLEECILGDGVSRDVILKLIGQSVGGALTMTWVTLIWSFHMMPEHEVLHKAAECQAGLQVTMLYGALIEGLITFISRLVALESTHWSASSSAIANSAATVALVLAALNTTGGFFNPVLASALTLGCAGNTVVEHFVVYWLGALVGGFIARYLHNFVENTRKMKTE